VHDPSCGSRRGAIDPRSEEHHLLLRVDIEDRGDHVVVIRTGGEIDAATADTLATAVSGALGDGYQKVLVDFTQVTFIDSTGLGVLVKSHRSAAAAGAVFAVVHPTAQTRKLIRVLGLDQLLNIYESHDEALADLP
jgi:anti-sigma B factor antagonist